MSDIKDEFLMEYMQQKKVEREYIPEPQTRRSMIYDPNKKSKYQGLAAKVNKHAKKIPLYRTRIKTKIDVAINNITSYFRPKKDYISIRSDKHCPYYNPV